MQQKYIIYEIMLPPALEQYATKILSTKFEAPTQLTDSLSAVMVRHLIPPGFTLFLHMADVSSWPKLPFRIVGHQRQRFSYLPFVGIGICSNPSTHCP